MYTEEEIKAIYATVGWQGGTIWHLEQEVKRLEAIGEQKIEARRFINYVLGY